MSNEYRECVYNLWTGFVGKATCEAGYLKCDGFSCPLYTPKKELKPQTNYDRLISKTPEELAEIMVSDCPPNYPHGNCREYEKYDGNLDCCKCWLDWLKSTVVEVNKNE